MKLQSLFQRSGACTAFVCAGTISFILMSSSGCQAPREESSVNPEHPAGTADTSSAGTSEPAPVSAVRQIAAQLQRADVDAAENSAATASKQPKLSAARDAAQPQHYGKTAEMMAAVRAPSEPTDRENYAHFDDNPVHLVLEQPVSTFSVDVDTAAYSNVRRMLNQGLLPRQDAVRIEELINYFSYNYAVPANADTPFSLYTELGPSPWHPQRKLLHIGIQGFKPAADALPAANLVFLIDVSGSMQSPDKLDLLKSSLKLLTRQLHERDRIAIVVYAGAAGTVLTPTAGNEQATIAAAIDQLSAGGSTNGGAGIHLAYALAAQGMQAGGINRVILATDGDFNVGTTDQQALKELVAEKRRSGVALSVLGFGSGNYNDALMQELAQIGNGNAAYIDTLNEARKVLVDELSSTLQIIARDVKIQVEFNPRVVAEYRLIGYESRHLKREDFNNDAVDAGDIGAGHTVTALYELTLQDSGGNLIDPLRYGSADQPAPGSDGREVAAQELGFLKLRYKTPEGSSSRLLSKPLQLADIAPTLAATSNNYRFSAAVAAFGQLLRGGEYLNGFDFTQAHALASAARGTDSAGYRGELLGLIRTAEVLATPQAVTPLELSQSN